MIHIYIYIPAPPSGTDKCVLLGCLVHIFGKRADSENNLIFEHIFEKVTVWTYFSKWLIMAMICTVFSFASPFQLELKHIRPNQPCWQACGWV